MLLAICAIVIISAISCSQNSSLPPDVSRALDLAGDNSPQLEAVLEHYSLAGDSLKYQAALFLIGNMEGHCYGTYRLVDTLDEDVVLDPVAFASYDELLTAVDSIEAARGELDFKKGEKVYDLETVTTFYLIDHIDLAFQAWEERPWAEFLTFDQFCQYVLPYRGSNEPMESWRQYYWDKYGHVVDSLEDPTDPATAAAIINRDVRQWFGFDQRYYFHPADQGHAEMLASGLGRCEDMTNVTIYALRANGIAVTSDYTPYWANSSGNHAWNALLIKGGDVVPFMGAEADPGSYSLSYGLAKAYRKTYAQQKNNLVFREREQEEIPPWLRGKNYTDVTSAYVRVTDVTMRLDKPVPDSVDIAYLCVFNSGNWEAIHWGRINSDSVVFRDMGVNVAYLPALYINKEIVPFGSPFMLDEGGRRRDLKADPVSTSSVALTSMTRDQISSSTIGVEVAPLASGTEYELFYCADGDWQSLGSATASDGPLSFDNVPSGGLYWIVAEDSREDERIFTIENGQQVWW
jgi:hypothetical protein